MMMGFVHSEAFRQWAPLTARVMLALVFIIAGFGKIMGFTGTVGFVSSVGLPMPEVFTVLAIIVEVGAGLMLLLGFWGRYAAKALFVFTLFATVIFHNNLADQAQMTAALKNLAMMGGMLLVMLHGTGPMSMKSEDEMGSSMM